MKKYYCKILVVLCLTQILTNARSSHGFNDEAHRLLSRRAAQPQVSMFDGFLRSVLGFEFPNGIAQLLTSGKTVTQHLEDGAVREDAGLRVRNHFHNPRLAWNQAGIGLPFTESSIVWAQNPSQLSFDKRSWQDARNYYFQALTATSDSERKRLYAETFRTLGHQIHHVQDAATPSHTRNDWHLSLNWFGGGPDPDAFHYWGETLAGQGVIGGSNPPPFDTSLLNQSGANPNAPIPIARIIDSTDGDIGTLALTPGISMGLAEYSSANFFSDDTINSPNFYSPSSSQVEVRIEADLSSPAKQRPYVYFLPGIGEQDYPLALASAMVNYVTDPLAIPTENGLDDKVFAGYGAKLFPRAIGYSAGLIDYFFRAQMTTGTAILTFPLQGGAYVNGFFVQNDSSETMTGNFYALAKYADEQNHSNIAQWNSISLANGEWTLLCLSSVPVGYHPSCVYPSQESQSSVEMSLCNPPPARMKHFTIVVKGDLGEEKNVSVGVGTYQDCGSPPQ